MNFTATSLNEICTAMAASLTLIYPQQAWVVLPDINVEKGQIGLFVSTLIQGTDRVVVSRPTVNLVTPWELGTPAMLNNLVSAFKAEFDALKAETDTAVETPVNGEPVAVGADKPAPKPKGRPRKVKDE